MSLRNQIVAYLQEHGDTGQTVDMIASALGCSPKTVDNHLPIVRRHLRDAREALEGPLHYRKPMDEGIKAKVADWLGDRDPHQFGGKEIARALGYETRAAEAAVRAALGYYRAQWRRARQDAAPSPAMIGANPYMRAARERAIRRVERMVQAGVSAGAACQQVYQETEIRLDPAEFQNRDDFGPIPVGESVERVLEQVERMYAINGIKAGA